MYQIDGQIMERKFIQVCCIFKRELIIILFHFLCIFFYSMTFFLQAYLSPAINVYLCVFVCTVAFFSMNSCVFMCVRVCGCLETIQFEFCWVKYFLVIVIRNISYFHLIYNTNENLETHRNISTNVSIFRITKFISFSLCPFLLI